MTQASFMAQLKKGLRGLPQDAVAAIEGDYNSYFAEGRHAGRTEQSLCDALGDPRRLAAELRLATHLERWRAKPSLTVAVRASLGLLALVALDLALLSPVAVVLLLAAGGLLAGPVTILFGLFLAGAGLFESGSASGILSGVGTAAAGVAATASGGT